LEPAAAKAPRRAEVATRVARRCRPAERIVQIGETVGPSIESSGEGESPDLREIGGSGTAALGTEGVSAAQGEERCRQGRRDASQDFAVPVHDRTSPLHGCRGIAAADLRKRTDSRLTTATF